MFPSVIVYDMFNSIFATLISYTYILFNITIVYTLNGAQNKWTFNEICIKCDMCVICQRNSGVLVGAVYSFWYGEQANQLWNKMNLFVN